MRLPPLVHLKNRSDTIGTTNIYPPAQQQNLAKAAKEIQQLLDQLEQNHPTPTEAKLIVERSLQRQPMLNDAQAIQQVIDTTPSLKQRLHSAGITAYIETVKTLLPPLAIAIETYKAWKNPEVD